MSWRVVCLLFSVISCYAQEQIKKEKEKLPQDPYKAEVNSNTIKILGGGISGASLQLIDDISRGLGKVSKLRIIPLKGGVVTNVRDILYLKGIDMGVVREDIVNAFLEQRYYDKELDQKRKYFRTLNRQLTYIALLHKEEFCILSSNPNIKTIQDLEGKVIASNKQDSISGQILFDKLGLQAKRFVVSTESEAAELSKLGEVDAIFKVTGNGSMEINRLLKIDETLKLVSIPYSEKLVDGLYFPTALNNADYPGLTHKNENVSTVAVNVILASYNWKAGTARYARLSRFVDLFFSNFQKVIETKGRHEKWREVNITAKMQKLKRFRPAEVWLNNEWKKQLKADFERKIRGNSQTKTAQNFQQFLKNKKAISSPQELSAIVEEFIKWRSTRQ